MPNPTTKIPIFFHVEAPITYQISHPLRLQKWLDTLIQNCQYQLVELNFILCSDEYLHKMNVAYLQHDTLTDVITFDNSDEDETGATQIEGDIFISLERIIENAQTYQVSTEEELYRVMAHGTLHLLGYGDKTPEQKTEMRNKEDESLALLKEM